jgi:hypothetical protein
MVPELNWSLESKYWFQTLHMMTSTWGKVTDAVLSTENQNVLWLSSTVSRFRLVKSNDGWKGVSEWVDIENNLQVCTAWTDEETAWSVTNSRPREEGQQGK